MFKVTKHFKKADILTIPNLLSFLRILLIPVIIWLYCVSKNYPLAVVLILISAATDIIDGFIARKFNMISDFGKIIDPIADKMTQGSLVICLITRYPIMWALLIVFLVKEAFMSVCGVLTLRVTDTVNSAKWYGKLNTVVLHTVIMVLIAFINIPQDAVTVLTCLCIGVMLFSMVAYGLFYRSVWHSFSDERQGRELSMRTVVNRFLLALTWGCLILLCFHYRHDITVEEVVRATPESPLITAMIMMVLFALKSVSVVVYFGILYAANGIMFSLPQAILLNILGTVIMVSLPYFIGRKNGVYGATYIEKKHKKLQMIHEMRNGNDFFFTFIVRLIGILPSDIVSAYFGAIRVNYYKYLAGCVLGMLPQIITFPIIGTNISNVGSPEFIVSVVVNIVLIAGSSIIFMIMSKRHKNGTDDETKQAPAEAAIGQAGSCNKG